MNFSVVLIAKNEEKTLPRLLKSLEGFKSLGGEVIVLDTGSTDQTVAVAFEWGCKVFAVEDKFIITISEEQANEINAKYIVAGEEPVITAGQKIFDYSSARNHAASLASNDMIAMPDCDEEYTALDLELVNKLIESGAEQLEYHFVFAHDERGKESLGFLHSKFYNRTKAKWVGVIHEVLSGDVKRLQVPPEIIKLEHWQQPSDHRKNYLPALAYDCYINPENDRNAHYFGRELVWTGRPQSAIKQLEQHIRLSKWAAEISQSYCFIGDAYLALGKDKEALAAYHQGFIEDPTRREALIRLAEYFYKNNLPHQVIAYCTAVLEIPGNSYFANQQHHYTFYPHEMLSWAYHAIGYLEKSKIHFDLGFGFAPLSSKFLHNYRFHYPLPKVSFIIPHLGREEGLQRCIESIRKLNYPQEKVEMVIVDGEDTVPKKVAEGLERATGEVIVYAANDMEFTPDSVILAYILSTKGYGLVAFNSGTPEHEHFLITRALIEKLGGQIFDTDFHHVGVDNYLWGQAVKLNQATKCEEAIVIHHHFSLDGEMDEVYERGWKHADSDRALLKEKLARLEVEK